MKVSPILTIMVAFISLSLSACNMEGHGGEKAHEQQTIVVTSPLAKDIVITQNFVCQIRSRRHINVQAYVSGYLEAIKIQEGQTVKEGDVMFQINPVLYKAKLAQEEAEVKRAQLEFDNTNRLLHETPPVVSKQAVALLQANLDKAKGRMMHAQAEVDFTTLKAPFDGIIDRLMVQQGSLIKEGKEGDVLTTLSDNHVMWVYFNVTESQYLDYMAKLVHGNEIQPEKGQVELLLANGSKFPQSATLVRKEGQFNNETGNMAFRADFPNPDGLLRHGQTGTLLIHQTMKNALLIPQRATFEILDKLYVYVVDKDKVVHQREIVVSKNEQDDIFLVKSGLYVDDKIVLEGGRQVHDSVKLEEYEYRAPQEVLANQKNKAE